MLIACQIYTSATVLCGIVIVGQTRFRAQQIFKPFEVSTSTMLQCSLLMRFNSTIRIRALSVWLSHGQEPLAEALIVSNSTPITSSNMCWCCLTNFYRQLSSWSVQPTAGATLSSGSESYLCVSRVYSLSETKELFLILLQYAKSCRQDFNSALHTLNCSFGSQANRE